MAREGDHEGSVDVSDGDGVGAVRPRFLRLVFAAAGGCVGWFGCRLCCGRRGVCRTGCCGGGLPRPASTAFCSAPSVAGSAALGCGWLRCAGAHPSVVSLGVWVCVGGSSLLAAVGGGLGGLLAVMVVRVFKPGCWCFTGGCCGHERVVCGFTIRVTVGVVARLPLRSARRRSTTAVAGSAALSYGWPPHADTHPRGGAVGRAG